MPPDTAATADQQAAEDRPLVLIVEDEPDVAATLARVIELGGKFRTHTLLDARSLDEVLDRLAPQLIFTDLVMPDVDGFAVIRRVRAIDADLPVVVVSAYASIGNAVRAVKAGAFDFLAKPFSPESVELILAKVERDAGLRRRAIERDPELAALIGESDAMVRLREWILKVRAVRASVLVEGESGTGKELVAGALHGGRGPFVAINVAAVPDTLAEVELFGASKGAYTGATRDRSGLFAQAAGGTLFLDEINATSPMLQAKLLRVLQDRRVRPVGAQHEIELDFRLVCATNTDLERLVREGRFRRDLYHRLDVLHMRIPPLRERREDIAVLAAHFVQRHARNHGCRARRIAEDAMAALAGAEWPGNVRQLENVIEQAVILCPADAAEIPLEVFPRFLGGQGWIAQPTSQPSAGLTLAQMEQRYVHAVLRQNGGNKSAAARALGIDYKTLLRKLSADPAD